MLLRAGEKNATDTVDQRAKVLLLFETKYCASSKSTPHRKALHALNGVVDYVNQCNIRRVCFVYCNTAVRDVKNAQTQHPYLLSEKPKKPNINKFKTLKDVMTELQRRGCTTSLHTVWEEDEWRSLLDSLYLIVPDMDEESIVPNAPIPLRRARPVNNIKSKQV
ncbi:Hypothetical protein, putative [Bodo saltans]|uniref:Uncharacterized protein n=1 Tax=Bodo saltans TaxID=75058 RepID=A0A0S4JSV9_BODSA|nr:Hypothetical protein, putative [Bodo saltans]|eukprot:CUG93451.1 Hypothetical protein, putative [Bodo saltans]